ncbi:hypothetical protein LSH36_797g01015 [Paralvinella palmiformis]|uniref:LRRCT domain-containing protein n=1 Tax=Paralvinella palmiformis TaxID=53620 RepID=A0AAD9J104_9ANNE|nr:hypothetical protein LSH36_797g01015 [Paralvinella palmiformis]
MASGKIIVHVFFMPYLFVVLPIISSSRSACPDHCTCDSVRHLVNCQNAGLRHVPWDLPDPVSLTHLDLSNNEITEINAPFVYSNLRYLDLSGNKIILIREGILQDLRALEVLTLKDNRLSTIDREIFDGMKELRKLDLSFNQLTSLDELAFAGLPLLEDLNLAGNLLSNISAMTFQGLKSLQYLDLEDNRIMSVNERGLFNDLRLLKVLSLGYNHLGSLNADVFSKLVMLRDLNLEDNKIAHVDDRAFSTIKPSPVPQLETLNLRNNKLSKVPTSALTHLSNLKMLDISQNPMEVLHSGAFNGLKQLRKVQVNAMPNLDTIQDHAFSELCNLEEIELHSNHRLQTLVEGVFLGTPELSKIDLHANALRTISINLLDWDSLRHLDLRYNRWHCDCHLAWLPHVLRERFNNATQYLTQEIRCFSPPDLATRLVVELHDDDLRECTDSVEAITPSVKPAKFQDSIMIAIMCTIGGILVIIIVVLMCKYSSSYRTAYAPAMDHYVYRNPHKSSDSDVESQKVPVIEGQKVPGLRSSLSSVSDVGKPRRERRLYRVRFAESDPN